MAADNRDSKIRQLLMGATVRSVGRAADMAVVELQGPQGATIGIHVQCPFRVLQEETLILGSRDMRYARQRPNIDAFDRFETVYDARAATLNKILGQLQPTVHDVTLGQAGSLAVEWQPYFRVEIFPDCSGSAESWRVFEQGGCHLGFPEDSI
ncbi:hypothetical protein [Streptomyces hydrogenans]|uniref:Uncharacterized protein n=1 Tax=Streptomyces hydrogenans TaxID=1873719 RepID=A0ABQ3PNL3_9ACTN|nr:hypothetical protein [Streptomyces hydrogenans]GHG41142.1 hypothetical protein GCM10018784_63600 [Streptomyces hydrogenans]GHI26603.1 hypothetical protein Shyd_79740 [Streptomyces hydrogenans]